MYSLVEENYLKALFHLSKKKGQTNSADVSKHLDIKMSSVNSMMKKLADKKLVVYQSYKPIKLTSEGSKVAALVIRKHRLTEMFLVEKMGFGWEEVHNIAEQIEHIHAPNFFAKMDELLGYPKLDPHGSPIPDSDGNMDWVEYITLSDCKEGDQVVLKAVSKSSKEFLTFLNEKNMKLGSEVKVIKKESFDGSMVLKRSDSQESFSALVCDKLLVTVSN